MRSVELAVRPPGHAETTPSRGRQSHRRQTSAAHRSAAMAGGARPDPFRTRKLSRRAPMVLRGQPVGEQGAADRWTALDPYVAGSGAGAPRGMPRGAPFPSPHIVQPRAPGALFSCRHPALSADRRGRAAPGSPALRPIRPACPPAVLLGPALSSGYRAPVPSDEPLARFPCAVGGHEVIGP